MCVMVLRVDFTLQSVPMVSVTTISVASGIGPWKDPFFPVMGWKIR